MLLAWLALSSGMHERTARRCKTPELLRGFMEAFITDKDRSREAAI